MSTYAIGSSLRPLAERTGGSGASRFRLAGIGLASAGLTMAAVSLIANLAVADGSAGAGTLAWSFGLGTLGFGAVMLGISVTLVGILVRLWLRVDAIKVSLPGLAPGPEPDGQVRAGEIETRYGSATVSERAPQPLAIHKMAGRMWMPMIAMGPMLVAAGFVVALVQSGESNPATFTDLGAIVQGTQFLGLALSLAGVSFLLGTILSSLRKGGGEAQEAAGVAVETLKMPTSAKAFVGLMAAGVMIALIQFGGYLAATGQDDPVSWFAWLAPVRALSLGLILGGVTLALYTIGTVLGFQFDRLSHIVKEGK